MYVCIIMYVSINYFTSSKSPNSTLYLIIIMKSCVYKPAGEYINYYCCHWICHWILLSLGLVFLFQPTVESNQFGILLQNLVPPNTIKVPPILENCFHHLEANGMIIMTHTCSSKIMVALLVWPREVEPWFHSRYRVKVDTLD